MARVYPGCKSDADPIDQGASWSQNLPMSEFEWTDADTAYANWEAVPDGHPVRVVHAFMEAAQATPLPVEALTYLVTPEVLADWGDWTSTAEFFRQGVGFGLNLRHIGDAQDVVYIKLIKALDEAMVLPSDEVPSLAYVTLVWRPERGGWKIHRIGEPAGAEDLPRTSPDDVPTY